MLPLERELGEGMEQRAATCDKGPACQQGCHPQAHSHFNCAPQEQWGGSPGLQSQWGGKPCLTDVSRGAETRGDPSKVIQLGRQGEATGTSIWPRLVHLALGPQRAEGGGSRARAALFALLLAKLEATSNRGGTMVESPRTAQASPLPGRCFLWVDQLAALHSRGHPTPEGRTWSQH